jgi:hypothetical protein
MEIPRIVSLLVLAVLAAPATTLATVIQTGTVEQPVNLGNRSDPTKIPLGPVPVVSNHGYDSQRIIGEARPCPDGTMRWEGGSELDQNLASVFGISVEAEDSTQVPGKPVTLRLAPWKVPAYSPYTKEQVLAATVWCLIRSGGGTPETPLKVLVVAEGPDDKPLEAKYTGEYITRRGNDGEEIPPVKVPGTVLEEDAKGITWVTFPEVPRKEEFSPVSPVMIVTESRGDGDHGWHVVPIWGSGSPDDDALRLSGSSVQMCHVVYPFEGVVEANALVADGGVDVIRRSFTANGDEPSVEFLYPKEEPETLAAGIFALALSTQPTNEKPLKVSIRVLDSELAGFAAFRNAADWKETPSKKADETVLECEFVWNTEEKLLVKGSVPLVQMKGIRWIERKAEEEVAKETPETALPDASQPEAPSQPDPETKPEAEVEAELETEEEAKPEASPELKPTAE